MGYLRRLLLPGLKAVTKAKLNYNPVELDPEEMVPLASKNPQQLAAYSGAVGCTAAHPEGG